MPLRRHEVAALQSSFGVAPDLDAEALQALVDPSPTPNSNLTPNPNPNPHPNSNPNTITLTLILTTLLLP